MFERYTERARRVLFFARYEASQLGSISIETEHLLLGLIREGKGLSSRLFARANLSLERIRREIEGRVVFREKVSTSVEIPFSPETKRVLQFSADEADRLLHNYIGTEHLLLGLLREERSVAATILIEAGLTLERLRSDIETMLAEHEARDPDEGTSGPERHAHFLPVRLPVSAYVPSTVVHIVVNRHQRQGAELSVGPHHWVAVDAPLRYVIARLHYVRDDRVRFTDARFDGQFFDVVLRLPRDHAGGEPAETLVLKALEEQLRVKITQETTPSGDVITVAPVQ